jgi:anti-sigma regulatory factor (Ser/Thr protein kinase)
MEGVTLDDDQKYYVELAVSEAVTNSLRHAYGNAPDREIGLRVTVEPGRLVVEVTDTGLPLDPAHIENATLPDAEDSRRESGGRGLFLIRQVMDEVRLTREGDRNVLTMIKMHNGLR